MLQMMGNHATLLGQFHAMKSNKWFPSRATGLCTSIAAQIEGSLARLAKLHVAALDPVRTYLSLFVLEMRIFTAVVFDLQVCRLALAVASVSTAAHVTHIE